MIFCSHALLVFGGLAGLELTIEADKALGVNAEDAEAVFDHWVNVCPNQGSRTIRTEVRNVLTLLLFQTYANASDNPGSGHDSAFKVEGCIKPVE
jgi:predicted SPOUT superfamily RNA methylase MTH1